MIFITSTELLQEVSKNTPEERGYIHEKPYKVQMDIALAHIYKLPTIYNMKS